MNIEKIRAEQEALAEAFAAWKATYEITNPPPEKLQGERAEANWWDHNKYMWFSIVFALGLYVASRTGWGIHEANMREGFSEVLSLIITALAVWAVEGFIAIFGFYRPRRLEVSKLQSAVEKSLWWFSLIIGLVVSATAGLDRVLGIAQKLEQAWGASVEAVLSVTLGIGMTFVLFGISEFIGRIKWERENKPLIEEHEHQQKLKAYRAEMQNAWTQSAVYLDIMGESLKRKAQMDFDIENANYGRRKVIQAERRAEIEALRTQPVHQVPVAPRVAYATNMQTDKDEETNKSALIREFLDAEKAAGREMPTLNTIAAWLLSEHGYEVNKSTISRARTIWMERQEGNK